MYFIKFTDLSCSVISIIPYPIPSDLGSKDDSSQASSTVGDHVRSPGTECFFAIFLSIFFTFEYIGSSCTVGDHVRSPGTECSFTIF